MPRAPPGPRSCSLSASRWSWLMTFSSTSTAVTPGTAASAASQSAVMVPRSGQPAMVSRTVIRTRPASETSTDIHHAQFGDGAAQFRVDDGGERRVHGLFQCGCRGVPCGLLIRWVLSFRGGCGAAGPVRPAGPRSRPSARTRGICWVRGLRCLSRRSFSFSLTFSRGVSWTPAAGSWLRSSSCASSMSSSRLRSSART